MTIKTMQQYIKKSYEANKNILEITRDHFILRYQGESPYERELNFPFKSAHVHHR